MAVYYWVGGTGTWNNTNSANWSLTSGGAGGAGVPTSADTVNFTSLSGSGTCSVDSSAVCGGATFNTGSVTLRLIASTTLMASTATFTHTFGTINLNNFNLTVGIWSSTNTNTRQIQFGTGQIRISGSGASVLNMGTLYPGWSYTGTPIFNLIYSGSTGTRTISVGATSGSVESQTPSVYVSAGSDIVSTGSSYFKDLNFSGFTGTLSTTPTRVIYGSLTFGSGMTVTPSTTTFFFYATSGSYTITSNNCIVGANFTFGQTNVASTASWVLSDDLSMGTTQRVVTLYNGTLNANGKNITIGSLVTGSGTNTFTLNMGSGTWSLFSPNIVWDVTTNPITLTINPSTSTIITTYSLTTNVTLNMGAYTYNNLTIGGTAGNNIVTINGGPTINKFTSTKTVTYTINFEASKTTTFSKFSVFGSFGKTITIAGTSASRATLKQLTGIVSGNYLSISYINGDSSADWYMGAQSAAFSGDNTNIKVANPPWGMAMPFFS